MTSTTPTPPAKPMSYERRLANYGGDVARLTPAQRKRLRKKLNAATAHKSSSSK